MTKTPYSPSTDQVVSFFLTWRWWLIAGLIVGVLFGTLVASRIPRQFTASAKVRVGRVFYENEYKPIALETVDDLISRLNDLPQTSVAFLGEGRGTYRVQVTCFDVSEDQARLQLEKTLHDLKTEHQRIFVTSTQNLKNELDLVKKQRGLIRENQGTGSPGKWAKADLLNSELLLARRESSLEKMLSADVNLPTELVGNIALKSSAISGKQLFIVALAGLAALFASSTIALFWQMSGSVALRPYFEKT